MSNEELEILRVLFYARESSTRLCSLTRDDLITQTGIDSHIIRPFLENLASQGILLERDSRYEISNRGYSLGKSRWV